MAPEQPHRLRLEAPSLEPDEAFIARLASISARAAKRAAWFDRPVLLLAGIAAAVIAVVTGSVVLTPASRHTEGPGDHFGPASTHTSDPSPRPTHPRHTNQPGASVPPARPGVTPTRSSEPRTTGEKGRQDDHEQGQPGVEDQQDHGDGRDDDGSHGQGQTGDQNSTGDQADEPDTPLQPPETDDENGGTSGRGTDEDHG